MTVLQLPVSQKGGERAPKPVRDAGTDRHRLKFRPVYRVHASVFGEHHIRLGSYAGVLSRQRDGMFVPSLHASR